MKRKTFDMVLTAGGAVLVVVLLVAGGLLMWGASFANNSVHSQLVSQKIFFPAAGSAALASPEIGPYLNQYAGQQLVTGTQAETYANHFIGVHLTEIAAGKTYAQVSAASLADPTNATLKAEAQTLFQGNTLRGLLLNAYAFSVFGMIALIAGIASFVLAGVMLVLTMLGMAHFRRVPEDAEFPKTIEGAHSVKVPVAA
jgi:hypothetical protein